MLVVSAVFVFLFGLALGSFLNVVIYRVPRGKSVVHPRSACPNCGKAIAFYDNIPVLSWLLLGCKCRHCKTPISFRYAVVELLTGGLFLFCYWHGFLSFAWQGVDAFPDPGLASAYLQYIARCWIFSFLLLGLIFIDAELQLLPDKLTIPGLVAALVLSLWSFVPGIPAGVEVFGQRLPTWSVSLANAIIGAAAGALFIYLAGELYFRVRGIEGMGFGDVKLMAMVGAFLGWQLALFTIFAASLFGSVAGIGIMLLVFVKRKRRLRARREPPADAGARAWQSARLVLTRLPIPFGVFLGSMALFTMFWGWKIVRWYLKFYD
jgi:leader peptidase (prepilin peptidase)/N-methyltransferase